MEKGRKEKGEKGVVRPRPTGAAASAIMQLLEVFGLAELREWGDGADGRAGADCSQHCPVGQDGGGEPQKRGGRT